jgi:hypothetical protein
MASIAITKNRTQRASALVIVLTIVSLITVLVVTLLLSVRFELVSSHQSLDHAQAELLADSAADMAISRIREAITYGTPNYSTTNRNTKTWSSQPGRIDIYDLTQGSSSIAHFDLFSANPGADDSTTRELNNVDLNKPSMSGEYPVTGSTSATMKVGWINLRPDISAAASATNSTIGRIAYWVDDETCKVNINTADGSKKASLYVITNCSAIAQSYGFGTPCEVSLAAMLPNNNQTLAATIASYAASIGFNSASEIGRADGSLTSFYVQNKFNITHTSKTPELNMFGEPRFYLSPAVPGTLTDSGVIRNFAMNVYGGYFEFGLSTGSPQIAASVSSPVTYIYPTSKQLPSVTYINGAARTMTSSLMPQCFPGVTGTVTSTNSTNYISCLRIASYLNGKNSQNQAITWPKFNSSNSSNAFTDKYTKRQIDSIVLQIHDMVQATMCDQWRSYSMPSLLLLGFLSQEPVSGFARMPKLTEMILRFSSNADNPNGYSDGSTTAANTEIAYITFQGSLEFYLPKYYTGAPLHLPYGGLVGSGMGSNTVSSLNYYDATSTTSSWMNNMLTFTDADTGTSAGIDLRGNPPTYYDPDQASAARYHPYCKMTNYTSYVGSLNGGPTATTSVTQSTSTAVSCSQALAFWSIYGHTLSTGALYPTWYPGAYHSIPNWHSTTKYYAKWDTTTHKSVDNLKISGGIALTSHTQSGFNDLEWAPLKAATGTTDSDSIIPVPTYTLPVPGAVTFVMRTRDPLVNKFPGDWDVSSYSGSITSYSGTVSATSASTIKEAALTSYFAVNYMRNMPTSGFPDPDFTSMDSTVTNSGQMNADGDNPDYRGANGGDPLSVWAPPQTIAIPKQARFPSVGALNFIRTGIIPDGVTTGQSAHGTPWRTISFASASSNGQATTNGNYPDWAMLDLFTVPYLPQPAATYPDTAPPLRILTCGGATEGKLNINNPLVPYPFSLTFSGVTQNPPQRTAPLNALFYGIKACTSYDSSNEPIYTTVSYSALTTAVQNYLAQNGPFMIPGQVANVPSIDAYTYQAGKGSTCTASPYVYSRNDVVRQIIGELTTQSNTYCIWVVAQTIKKAPGNTQYDRYESGDTITGEVRRRYLVERYINTGKDGVPGNAPNPGLAGYMGTNADSIDANYHPSITYPIPYSWRTLAVEDVSR